MKKLKVDKAVRLDGVATEYLKSGGTSLVSGW